MDKARPVDAIDLVDTLSTLRSALERAAHDAEDQVIRFPITSVELEFHIGVTKAAEGGGGVKFWVLELGAKGKYEAQSIQRVTLSLGTPITDDGTPVHVRRRLGENKTPGRARATLDDE